MKRDLSLYRFGATFKAGLCLLVLFFSSSQSKLFAQTDSLLFADGFNDSDLGQEWHAYYTWSETNGSATNFIDGTGGILRTTRSFTADSYVIETAARGFTNSYWREFKITFGHTSLTSDSAYVLNYAPHSGGKLTLGKATDNIYSSQILDEVIIAPDLDAAQWYTFKIAKYKSGLIQVYINKGAGYEAVPVLEAIDHTYLQLGHFGWQEDTQTSAQGFYVDWIEARKPGIEKPATREKDKADDLIVQVTATSGAAYKVVKLKPGTKAYTDRAHEVVSWPAYLENASFVQTAMEDRTDVLNNTVSMFISKTAVVYVGYDAAATQLPAWLAGWTKTGDTIRTTSPTQSRLLVYSKLIEHNPAYPKPLILGGNLASPAAGAKVNYIVAAIEKPRFMKFEAEDAKLDGTVIARNHNGYSGKGFADFINKRNDYIEWTVKVDVPGTYALSFNYSNGPKGSRSMSVGVDGGKGSMHHFTTTHSWDNWATHSGSEVYLTKGTHIIRATAIGFSGPNMDFIGLSFINASQVPSTKTINSGRQRSEPLVGNSDNSSVAYPNPFAEATTIKYTLKEAVPVHIAVYNMAGQQVEVLVNETQVAGEHKIVFRAGPLQNGLYFYRIETGGQVQSGKLMKQ